MYSLHDQAGDKDLARTRTFELENGNKLIAQQTDPYGFWRLHLAQGKLPEWLDQSFNEWGQVLKAVARYTTQRKEALEEIERREADKAAKPVLKVKPGFNRDGTKIEKED
jgi:hypothetical protein